MGAKVPTPPPPRDEQSFAARPTSPAPPGAKPASSEIFAPGTAVLLNGDIEGIVCQACVSFRGVQYQVAWWDKTTRTQQWVEDIEVSEKPGSSEKRSIGFLPEAFVPPEPVRWLHARP